MNRHPGRAPPHIRAPARGAIRRRRLLASGLLAAAVALSVALASGGHTPKRHSGAGTAPPQNATVTSSPHAKPRPSSFAVGLRVLRLVDASRTVELPNRTSEPRTLLTYVRYPALGAPGRTDLPDAPPARADGPFPLIVFGHGFDVTPALYAHLLQTWARAGYVVAAPVFPLENADAPGGADESDLTNQPDDMRFVISRILAASSANAGPFAGLVDPTRIAVTGQSDGGDTMGLRENIMSPHIDDCVLRLWLCQFDDAIAQIAKTRGYARSALRRQRAHPSSWTP